MLGLAGDPALARLEMGRSVSYDDGPVPVRPAPVSPPISRSRSDGGAVSASATKPPLGGRSPGSSEATPEGEEEEEEEEADPRCLIRNLDDGSEFVVKEGPELREVGTGRQLTMEEFVDPCVGRSPIVQELMRRENVASSGSSTPVQRSNSDSSNGATRHQRRRRHSSWLRGIRNVAGSVVASSRDRRSSDDKDTCSDKGGRRSSSATDDSQDSTGAVRHGPVRVKVRQYGKSYKDFSGLFMNQEIQAHDGSIWSIRFSPDGWYLASAGEECVIHVWEVSEFDRKHEENGACNLFVAMVCNGSPEPTLAVASSVDGSNREKKRRARLSMEGESDAPDRRPSLHGRGVLSIRVRAVHGRNLAVSASPLGFNSARNAIQNSRSRRKKLLPAPIHLKVCIAHGPTSPNPVIMNFVYLAIGTELASTHRYKLIERRHAPPPAGSDLAQATSTATPSHQTAHRAVKAAVHKQQRPPQLD
ncbi:hypothetical protein ACJX0J_015640, partial [Zea mays]